MEAPRSSPTDLTLCLRPSSCSRVVSFYNNQLSSKHTVLLSFVSHSSNHQTSTGVCGNLLFRANQRASLMAQW